MKQRLYDTEEERLECETLHRKLLEMPDVFGLAIVGSEKITVEELNAKFEQREKQRLDMPLRQRVLFAFHDFRSNWEVREFYHSSWLVNEIKKDIRLIFRIPSDKREKR